MKPDPRQRAAVRRLRRFHLNRRRPRDDQGRFAPGWQLWTRHWDGFSRWLFWPNDEAAPISRERMIYVTEVNRRVIRDLIVIVVAALLVFLV